MRFWARQPKYDNDAVVVHAKRIWDKFISDNGNNLYGRATPQEMKVSKKEGNIVTFDVEVEDSDGQGGVQTVIVDVSLPEDQAVTKY